MIDLLNVPIHLKLTGGALLFLALVFVVFFLVPSVIHWYRLRRILNALATLKRPTPPSDIKKFFARDKRLAHLWSEYEDTLHVQRELQDGQMKIVAVRSTIPAESYFSGQYLVDSRLRTEFFKHLPGLFTGVGIIGTFSGLIEGLSHFQVSENAVTARASLESLMHAVGEAFLISAFAIAAAMLVTFVEKLILAGLYRKAEEIAHAIDAQFDAGAGEEYLARLVSASEASASQAKILKDALVTELGDILRELTASQTAAAQRLNTELGATISRSIEESLRQPLEEIGSSVKKAAGDQSASAVQMLNDVMVSFSQRLNDLFGGQINGINELNQQTAQGIRDAVNSLHTLVGRLEESGKRTTDGMAARMAAAIQAMEERQRSMNAEWQAFVEQIRKLLESSQEQTQEKLQETLESVDRQMTTILAKLTEAQAKTLEGNREREEAMKGMVADMTGKVEAAIREIKTASQDMSQSVSALSNATTSSIDKLNAGAERLNSAAESFRTAGGQVAAVMNRAETVSAKLAEVSGSLTTSASAVKDALQDYRAQREAVTQLLAEVRATVDLASKEASITADVLQRIEASTEKLGAAQKAADAYLDGVSQVLAESSEAFRASVMSTLSQVNHDFHTKLASAVGLLSTTVQELEVTLGSFAPRR